MSDVESAIAGDIRNQDMTGGPHQVRVGLIRVEQTRYLPGASFHLRVRESERQWNL